MRSSRSHPRLRKSIATAAMGLPRISVQESAPRGRFPRDCRRRRRHARCCPFRPYFIVAARSLLDPAAAVGHRVARRQPGRRLRRCRRCSRGRPPAERVGRRRVRSSSGGPEASRRRPPGSRTGIEGARDPPRSARNLHPRRLADAINAGSCCAPPATAACSWASRSRSESTGGP